MAAEPSLLSHEALVSIVESSRDGARTDVEEVVVGGELSEVQTPVCCAVLGSVRAKHRRVEGNSQYAMSSLPHQDVSASTVPSAHASPDLLLRRGSRREPPSTRASRSVNPQAWYSPIQVPEPTAARLLP